MKYEDTSADTPEDVANLFAQSFSTYFRSDDDENFCIEDVLRDCGSNANEVRISMFDIEKTIGEIKMDSAVGTDGISPKVIRNCQDAIIWPLWILFQKTLDEGVIPSDLKMSRIIPIHKKGAKSDVKNYRMVAVGTMILRIFEKTVNRKLAELVETKLSPFQHGFRPGRSVTTNLLSLTIAAHDAFSRGNQLDVFYGDFEKAFDRVSHPILLRKLVTFGIGPDTIKWIANFLRTRGNFVQIGKFKSKLFYSDSGVGAGTSLGPLLFLLFINDLTIRIRCTKILMLADDFKIFVEVASELDAQKLRLDLTRLGAWCKENKLDLNIDKCFIISLHRKKEFIDVQYEMYGNKITRVNEIRDLGVTVDSRLDFVPHIQSMIAGARQTLGYIKWISGGRFAIGTLKLLYTSYVRSKLEFAAVIWDPYQSCYQTDIESVQKQFLLYLLGDNIRKPPYRIAPYDERCKLVEMQTLYKRRLIAKLMLGYDVQNEEFDPTISSKIIPYKQNYDKRHIIILVEKTYRNNYSKFQPIASIIRLVNEYSKFYNEAKNRNEFKRLILKKLCDFVEPSVESDV